jgi:NAD(P)H dehydrogenase (quinone)
MAIIISGASGDLGRRVTRQLLSQVPASDLILTTRNPDALTELAGQGARVRKADLGNPEALAAAFSGGHIMLLISTLSIGHRRIEHHRNAIEAAKKAGVGHIVYTSSVGMHPRTPCLSGQEHWATEQMLHQSGLAFTMLRDSWYADVVAQVVIKPAIAEGKIEMSMGDGYVAPVAKQDCANAAAAVLRDPGRHAGATYEITGPLLMTLPEIVALASDATGKPLAYVDISLEEQQARFDAMGINREYYENMENESHTPWASNEMISYQMAIKQGFFAVCSRHVQFITGQPAMTMRQVIEANGPYDNP